MNGDQIQMLHSMKKLIKDKKCRFEIRKDRGSYLQDLLTIGISVDEAWNQILSLNTNFYFFDAKPNYKSDGNALVFKKKINGILTYIKLKMEHDDNQYITVCLSFHKDKVRKEE